jgi:hypothetical protein
MHLHAYLMGVLEIRIGVTVCCSEKANSEQYMRGRIHVDPEMAHERGINHDLVTVSAIEINT